MGWDDLVQQAQQDVQAQQATGLAAPYDLAKTRVSVGLHVGGLSFI